MRTGIGHVTQGSGDADAGPHRLTDGNPNSLATPSQTPTAAPTATPTPKPTATATPVATICGTTLASSAPTVYSGSDFAVGSSVTLPALGSCSSTVSFESGTTFNNPNVTVTTSQVPPAGAPSPLPTLYASQISTPLLYETLTINSGSISVTSSQQQSLTVGTFPPGGCSILQYFGFGGKWYGPNAAAPQGNTAAFPTAIVAGTTLSAGSTYYEYFTELMEPCP